MNKIISILIIVLLLCCSSTSYAEDHPFHIGLSADIGVPSGVAIGLLAKPKLEYVTVGAALTHNVLAFGCRGSVKLDPLAMLPNFPIGLFADIQGGFASQGNIPSHSDYPSVGYSYLNLYGGLRLGKSNGFHWNFAAGPSYMKINPENYQKFISSNGIAIGKASITGWVTPTFITGFEVFFN